uniref:Urotensin-2 n=2 Tax=Acipenseroidei TaxID=186622 RepID=UTS2_POLSP|nr:RecName: Full=Urotensin-2; AltName: Full=Urotensin II; Short=U-II; Short=UII [Polyodon spathula]AAB23711.1 urotensin II, UII [Acipenser ruthenus=sturgeons, spinal cord, Peptide, 12 aa] [Acipenser ruthenus]AAB47078.1 urotensin II, UII [Polyodon spathula=paddlefish, spinal cord neuronal tissues, Peptide, 12 aa] [Polyodon spathula]AAB47079.1 urotensin II, UII [Acipenser ruthenus=sturgeon, spinal cord, Peptide, 12 aa] [Acipenser ruthenus]
GSTSECFWKYCV